jgi:hypothetical protein
MGIASASPIGFLGIGSSGFVQATLTSLNWTPDASAIGVCPGAPCNGNVNSATTLSFVGAAIPPGTPNTLLTTEGVLINNGFPFGAPPPPTAGLFNPFLQFALHPTLSYTLTGVDAGSPNTDCAAVTTTGQSCSILVAGTPSPVLLTKKGTSTDVGINMFGFATDEAGSSNWTGGFSATIPNITPEQILLALCPSGTCTAADVEAARVLTVRSVSGSFFASAVIVPEPGTIALFLAGFGFLAVGMFRRKSAHR